MNHSLARLLRLAAVAVGTATLAGFAFAADPVLVTKLRPPKVVMFDAPENGSPVGEVGRDQYVAGAWTVAGEAKNGYLPIKADGKSFWVKTFAVDTDRKVAASAECGVVLASAERKIGATRALGEECRK